MYVTQLELGYLLQITALSASRKVLQKTEKAEKDILKIVHPSINSNIGATYVSTLEYWLNK